MVYTAVKHACLFSCTALQVTRVLVVEYITCVCFESYSRNTPVCASV